MDLRLSLPFTAICSFTRVLAAIGMFALVTGGRVHAVAIGIDLGHAPHLTSQIEVPFDALNAVSLNGQTLSLDFMFTKGEFARLFTVTGPSFATLLTLQTNGSGLVGFLAGTGFLLDQQGNPLQSPQDLGSASGNDGSMDAALFPLLPGQLPRPIDFFGIHYDLTLPTNSSVAITGADLQLIASGLNHDDLFGIGPGVPRDIVPDGGGTSLFLGLGLAGLIGIRIRLISAA